VKFIEGKAVKRPPETPIIPEALPILAVFYEANPAIPAIQHNEEAKYPAYITPVNPYEYAVKNDPANANPGIEYK